VKQTELTNHVKNRAKIREPKMINKYLWAKGVVVQVNIYSEDCTGRGY